MQLRTRQPSVRLEPGKPASDSIADAARNRVGVRETARRSGLSPTAVSLWIGGRSFLPWDSAMAIAQAVGCESHLWTATLHDRIAAAEALGWDFHESRCACRRKDGK
jgi:DNA-binding transcriptional regulator YdaS (Cro superfamily)